VSGAGSGLTVVVPCLNESGTLQRMYDEVTTALAHVDDLELLLVDDGSTDDTLARMRALADADPRVRYLSLTRNGGLEAAQSAGFRYASKPWTAQIDCDLQFPPSEIPKLLERAAEGYDLVLGVRQRRQDPRWRRWGSTAQHWVARRLFGIEMPAGASSFRVVRTAVARTISDLRLGTPYFLATAPRIGARYTTVPVAHHRRVGGGSRFRLTRLFGHSFELLFGHSLRPLNASYLVATLGVIVALTLAALGVTGVAGPVTLGVGAVLIAGATLAVVALVGRYLHRLLLDQQRPRPYYIREANVPLHPEDRIDAGVDPVAPPLVTVHAAAADGGGGGGGDSGGGGPLLVLGASDDQLPVYREARRRGVPTIAVDRRSDLPALRYADEHLPVSIRDPAAIAAALGDRVPRAVIASGGELGIWSWYELSERYRTRYRFPRSAAIASTDKAVFHAAAAKAGVNTYRWRHGSDPDALIACADEVGFPLVVKPADGSGKRGITLVAAADELPAALERAAAASYTRQLIIEQLLAGRDLTVDVFLQDGQVAFSAVHEKLTGSGDGFRVRGHITPAPMDAPLRQRLVDTAALLCRQIGLTDGPADFDLFLTDDGAIEVVEVNARMPGEAVPLLIHETYGVDLVAALVSLVLGDPVDLSPAHGTRVGLLHMLASPLATPGVLREVRGVSAVQELPGVARCEVYVEPGTVVPPFPQLGHEVGYLVVVADDRGKAEAALAAALDRVEIVVDPGVEGASDRVK
jgi:biotin carboxylase